MISLVQDISGEVQDFLDTGLGGFERDGEGFRFAFFFRTVLDNQALVQKIENSVTVFLVDIADGFVLFGVTVACDVGDATVVKFQPSVDNSGKSEQIGGEYRVMPCDPAAVQVEDGVRTAEE